MYVCRSGERARDRRPSSAELDSDHRSDGAIPVSHSQWRSADSAGENTMSVRAGLHGTTASHATRRRWCNPITCNGHPRDISRTVTRWDGVATLHVLNRRHLIIIRPDLVLQIDRRQKIGLLSTRNMAVIPLALVDKESQSVNHVFWKLRLLSVAYVVFNCDLLPTDFNSGNWSRSVNMDITLLHRQFVKEEEEKLFGSPRCER